MYSFQDSNQGSKIQEIEEAMRLNPGQKTEPYKKRTNTLLNDDKFGSLLKKSRLSTATNWSSGSNASFEERVKSPSFKRLFRNIEAENELISKMVNLQTPKGILNPYTRPFFEDGTVLTHLNNELQETMEEYWEFYKGDILKWGFKLIDERKLITMKSFSQFDFQEVKGCNWFYEGVSLNSINGDTDIMVTKTLETEFISNGIKIESTELNWENLDLEGELSLSFGFVKVGITRESGRIKFEHSDETNGIKEDYDYPETPGIMSFISALVIMEKNILMRKRGLLHRMFDFGSKSFCVSHVETFKFYLDYCLDKEDPIKIIKPQILMDYVCGSVEIKTNNVGILSFYSLISSTPSMKNIKKIASSILIYRLEFDENFDIGDVCNSLEDKVIFSKNVSMGSAASRVFKSDIGYLSAQYGYSKRAYIKKPPTKKAVDAFELTKEVKTISFKRGEKFLELKLFDKSGEMTYEKEIDRGDEDLITEDEFFGRPEGGQNESVKELREDHEGIIGFYDKFRENEGKTQESLNEAKSEEELIQALNEALEKADNINSEMMNVSKFGNCPYHNKDKKLMLNIKGASKIRIKTNEQFTKYKSLAIKGVNEVIIASSKRIQKMKNRSNFRRSKIYPEGPLRQFSGHKSKNVLNLMIIIWERGNKDQLEFLHSKKKSGLKKYMVSKMFRLFKDQNNKNSAVKENKSKVSNSYLNSYSIRENHELSRQLDEMSQNNGKINIRKMASKLRKKLLKIRKFMRESKRAIFMERDDI